MPKECAAADCSELQNPASDVSFHLFPLKEPVRLRQWLINMNRLDPKTKQLWQPGRHDVLCSKHFEEICFTMRTRISKQENLPYNAQLLPDAVPTIFLHKEEARKRSLEAEQRRSGFAKRKRKEQMLSDILDPVTPQSSQDQLSVHSSSELEMPDVDASDELQHHVSVQTDTVQARGIGVQTIVKSAVSVAVAQQTVEVTPTAAKSVQVHASTQTKPLPDVHVANTTDAECQTESVGVVMDCNDSESEDTEKADGQGEKDENWEKTVKKETRRTLTEDLHNMDVFKEEKYLVFEGKLEELLSVCRSCSKECQVMRNGVEGTAVEFCCKCDHCGHKFIWNSQPYSKRLPLGNLVLAAVAFFTACSPTRLITLFKTANTAIFCHTTYNSLQGAYMLPAVRRVWTRCQARLFAARPKATCRVKLAGDSRCDSPGHCAKYGAYSFMDAQTAEVLHIELVQSNTVKNSHAMEQEGLKNGLRQLKEHVSISHLVTDRHSGIKCYMKNEEPGIMHRFDVWHMAKGVGKKIEAASHKRGYEVLGMWSKSIKHHMYYSSQSTEEGPRRVEKIKEKWCSVSNHISNQHQGHGGTFPNCLHPDLSDSPKAWIRKGTPQHRALEGIVKSPYLLRAIGLLSPDVQTAHLEAFHAVINHFAPKMLHFTFPVMQAKLYLAAMHVNANASRQQATTDDGELQWKIARPRAAKGQPTAKPVKDKATRCYLNELFEEVVILRLAYNSYKKATQAQADYYQTVPETLGATAGPVDKAHVVAKQQRRLNWHPTCD